MKPRNDVFHTYWRFAHERQQIFFRRLAGAGPPWTQDPILRQFKFCNAYRASDRVSQYLLRQVLYPDAELSDLNRRDLILRTLLFRCFNRVSTWEYLMNRFGTVRSSTFEKTSYIGALDDLWKSGKPIFGNAFILCASKTFGHERKHANYIELIDFISRESKEWDGLLSASTLGGLYHRLLSYPMLGAFMAYQIAIDLNYSLAFNFSENGFTVAGPGALRGIQKCFVDTDQKAPEYIIRWMTENQDEWFQRLNLDFATLWGRKLHSVDCQGLFCEVDKYSRVAFAELKSNRTTIKSKFRSAGSLSIPFYPPKWGINERIEKEHFRNEREDQLPLLAGS